MCGEAGIATLDNRVTLNEFTLSELGGSIENYYGPGFFSIWRDKCSQLTAPSVLNLINNRSQIPRIILFDMLISNLDRNPGNILIDLKKGEKGIHIIDHSHIFELGSIWDSSQLERLLKEEHKCTDIIESNNYLYRMFFESYHINIDELNAISSEFQSKLSKSEIRDIIEETPTDWNISSIEIDILTQYINRRLNDLQKIALDIVEYMRRA